MRIAAALALSAALASCLPGDERPAPGALFVATAPNTSTTGAFTTDDGWTVRYDRFVTAVGDVLMEHAAGNACIDYADDPRDDAYNRLIDWTRPERRLVGLGYGLGRCNVTFALRPPDEDTVLEAGTHEADVARMGTRINRGDIISEIQQGAVVLAVGRAQKGAVEKRFDLILHGSAYLRDCPALDGDELQSLVDLRAGSSVAINLEAHGDELFRAAPLVHEPPRFEPFAAADRDGNGIVTSAELDAVEPPYSGSVSNTNQWYSHLVMIQDALLQRMVRMSGAGPCAEGNRFGFPDSVDE
jgi:hypothetical protein